MVRLTAETNHDQVQIHLTHDEIEISVQDLRECKTVAINFNDDLHIFLTPDQARELSDLLGNLLESGKENRVDGE